VLSTEITRNGPQSTTLVQHRATRWPVSHSQ